MHQKNEWKKFGEKRKQNGEITVSVLLEGMSDTEKKLIPNSQWHVQHKQAYVYGIFPMQYKNSKGKVGRYLGFIM